MKRLTDKEYKKAIGVLSISRRSLKIWKKEYYKKYREESPVIFFHRIVHYLNTQDSSK